jgi:BirA family biotin operon repressor/biotin-[acetyl-CoA-carboxylase] ligase
MDFRIKKIQLEQIESTQNYLKQIISDDKFNEESKNNLKDIKVVIAYEQLKGRGSNNRHWISLKGGLYLSFNIPFFKLKLQKKYFNLISIIVGTIVIFSFLRFFKNFYINFYDILKKNLRIIFPNDIVLIDDNKIYKLGGILIENFKDNLIIGIGINIFNEIESYFIQNKDSFDHFPISLKEFILKKNLDDINTFFKFDTKLINNLSNFIFIFVIFYLLNLDDELFEKIMDYLYAFDYTPYLRNIKIKYIKIADANFNEEVQETVERIIPDYKYLIFKIVKKNIDQINQIDLISFSQIRRIFY